MKAGVKSNRALTVLSKSSQAGATHLFSSVGGARWFVGRHSDSEHGSGNDEKGKAKTAARASPILVARCVLLSWAGTSQRFPRNHGPARSGSLSGQNASQCAHVSNFEPALHPFFSTCQRANRWGKTGVRQRFAAHRQADSPHSAFTARRRRPGKARAIGKPKRGLILLACCKARL